MINPTFASFKAVKPGFSQQSNFTHQSVLGQIGQNSQPKTFHQLKASAQIKNHAIENRACNMQQSQLDSKLCFSNNYQLRKAPMNYVLRKNYSDANMTQIDVKTCYGQQTKSKPKITVKNYLTAKKNYQNADKVSKDKSVARPCILAPSLLKNKSFIYTINNQSKQNYTSRPSHDGYKGPFVFSQDMSIDSIERKSDQASMSVGSSSNGDRQVQSFLNSSRLQQSITLNLKDSFNSQKLQDKVLNFSRKTNKTIYKGDLNKYKSEQDSTIFGQLPSLSLMAKQLKSSFQSEVESNSKSYQNKSINFSKKFQQYKRPNQNVYSSRNITIDQFQLLQQLGQGKYGKVYMARHKFTGFICALKAFSKLKIKQQNIQEPLIRQIKIQMYLNHPNIVKLYGFFNDKDNLYLIMQCCYQGHLLKLIKQRKIFDQNEILQIISNVYEAVSFLHCHGIIHRDIKPQNIVIQNGVFKICDFGWAAYAKGDTRTTFCGTPLYVCPQVLKGKEYDEKADIWGLGVLTYQLAYGRVPFPIWSQSDMIKIVKDPVYFPTWTSVSEKMQNLIKSMLNKDPCKRLSLNQILSSSLITQYVRTKIVLKNQVQILF